MRAVIYHQSGELPVVAEIDEPACAPDGVVLRVGATGVCRSDWHSWLGHDPVPLPMVPGHEYAGEIVAVGAEVSRWHVGDRVTVPFACGCGRCEWCAAGQTHVCPDQQQPGFTSYGSWAELVAVPAADANVVALPPSVGYVEAAALGCRFATAYHAVTAHGRPAAGDRVAVHGCGGVGLSAVMVAVQRGARVVGVDSAPAAREAALKLGAEAVVPAEGLDAHEVAGAVHDLTGGGAHVSIDALGGAQSMAASIGSLRRRGRHVQVGLMLEADAMPRVPMGRVLAEELELHGSHGMPASDYPEMLALVASGAFDVRRLVGRVITLDEAPDALVAMSAPPTHAGMTVVDLRG